MFDFALVVSKSSSVPPRVAMCAQGIPSIRPYPTDETRYHQVGSSRLWVWKTACQPFISLAKNLHEAGDGGAVLYFGHAVTGQGRLVADAEFYARNANNVSGNFVALRLLSDGTGRIERSAISSFQIYFAESDECAVVSSSVFVAAKFLGQPLRLDPDFARWVLTYGKPGNRRSILAHVDNLQMGEELFFSADGLKVTRSSPEFLYSPDIHKQYDTDRKRFWDHCFDKLANLSRVISLSADEISFPLSGGKDSRLLLSLLLSVGLKDKISDIYTNGPEVSPEVRSARLVCDHFGLPHRNIDNTNVEEKRSIIVSDRLLTHLFVSEGETSPLDLSWRTKAGGGTSLHGQVGGLRSISRNIVPSNRNELDRWFYTHLGGGDMCNIFLPSIAERNILETEMFVNDAISHGIKLPDMPTFHRLMFQHGRWVGRTWKIYNSLGFSPYIFVNGDIVEHTFGAGPHSRAAEEFHYQMLKRCNPELLAIPFAGQTWPDALTFFVEESVERPKPLNWPEKLSFSKQRPSHEVLQANRSAIVDYFETTDSPVLNDIVAPDRLRALCETDLTGGHFGPLWQLLQLCLFERVLAKPVLSFEDMGELDLPKVDIQ